MVNRLAPLPRLGLKPLTRSGKSWEPPPESSRVKGLLQPELLLPQDNKQILSTPYSELQQEY